MRPVMTADLQAKNAYQILGVPRDASLDAVKQAYRALARKHYPDAVPAEEKAAAANLFARINLAYGVLGNASNRRNYDALLSRGITPDLAEAAAQTSGTGPGKILEEIELLNL